MKNLIKISELFLVVIFIISQLIMLLSINNIVLHTVPKLLFFDKNIYHGVIFISGEFPVEFIKNSFTIAAPFLKINAILNKFDNYLYLINGYFYSPIMEKQKIIFILNLFKRLNVSAINLTEIEINNIYPLVLSNRDLFISANQNKVNVLPFKIIPLTLSSTINQKRSIPIFITGVSSRFLFYKNNDFEAFHSYIEETTDQMINSLNELYNDAQNSKFRLLLFDCDQLFLDKIINKTRIHFNLVICSNSNKGNKIIKDGPSYIMFCDRFDKKITKIDIYLKNDEIYFKANEIPLFRRLLSKELIETEFKDFVND
jgi:hypothetical protein